MGPKKAAAARIGGRLQVDHKNYDYVIAEARRTTQLREGRLLLVFGEHRGAATIIASEINHWI